MQNSLLILFIWTILSFPVIGQDCHFSLSGQVIDHHEEKPMEYAAVYLEETGTGAMTDPEGRFLFENLCAGSYHLRVSHIGCDTRQIFLTITADTFITILMEHHNYVLEEVRISSSVSEKRNTQTTETIGAEALRNAAGKTLGEISRQVSGVSAIRSGAVFKPIIHGMYGNRISVLNNGIIQTGQQWGLDHAPEIDPFAAQNIQIIKGASSIRYGGNNLGGVIIMNPALPPDDPHIHGNAYYIFNSNGRGHQLAATLEQKAPWFTWRLVSSLKNTGDLHTPNYFLNNTGSTERNIALDLHRTFNPRLKAEGYYALFNSKNGILRGAHIGNTTDLENALTRTVPFFTEEDFSYDIEAPFQKVQHHLFKTKWKYLIDDKSYLDFTYAFQLNLRQEFDVRRGGRTDIPAMDLSIFQHFGEFYYKRVDGKHALESGLHFAVNDNTNTPGTGILPLIPNYIAFSPSAFSIYTYTGQNYALEWGGRYDFRYFDVVRSERNVIHHNIHQFHNLSFDAGAKFNLLKNGLLSINSAYTLRSPEINELYSMGLHQGVASIEEGNPDLKQESGIKTLVNLQYQKNDFFQLNAAAYHQYIQNFIYLIPEPEFRLTIRGAFPVFTYQQTDANILGFDLSGQVYFRKNLKWYSKYAIIRGKSLTTGSWLIRMPSDNLSNTLHYEFNLPGSWDNLELSMSHQYVWSQTRFNPDEELAPPPPAYQLVDIAAHSGINIGKLGLSFGLTVENVFNVTYRDYLDRLRFFADAPGRNIKLQAKLDF